MRISEIIEDTIKSIKPKPPLSLPQARIAGLKQNVVRDRQRLQQERDRQRQQSVAHKQRKQRVSANQAA
jgi:hypothetical protein